MKRLDLTKVKDFFNNLKKSRVLYASTLTMLTLSMFIVSSFAWLTLNRKTGVGDMGMGLAVDDTNAVYEAYMYDLEKGAGTDLNADGEKLNVTNIDLNQYDTIFKAQNKYTPVFAKIRIVRNESMPKNGTVHVTIERDDMDTGDKLTAFSSSVIRFTTFIIADKSDVNLTAPKDLYTLINDIDRFDEIEGYKGAHDNSKTFVTVNGEGADHTHSKNTSLTISVDYVADNWYQDVNNNNSETLNVYLYITYDVQLVECYMDENAGGGLSLEDNSVFFENDLKKITVSYSANN